MGSPFAVLMVALVVAASFPNAVYADPLEERVEVGALVGLLSIDDTLYCLRLFNTLERM